MALFETARRWCCRRLRCGDFGTHADQLLIHFLLQLGDEFLYAKHPSGEDPIVNPEIAAKVEELLKSTEPPAWERAYEIERLLVYLRLHSKLVIETDRRVAEAESLKLPSAAKYRAQLDKVSTSAAAATELAQKGAAAVAAAPAAAPDPALGANPTQLQAVAEQANVEAEKSKRQADNERRAILAAVLDDLQWFYQQRILKRRALWASAWNLAVFGVITISIVAIPFLAFLAAKIGWSGPAGLMINFPNYGLFTAMSFGLLGSFFSRLISLQFTSEMTVEDAENRYGPTSLLIRGAVGMCGAAIIYFLLGTELLGQTVKPSFTEKLSFVPREITSMLAPTKVSVLMPSADWCLLIMWSFLAGFSERLVPDSLARAEGQVSGKQKQP